MADFLAGLSKTYGEGSWHLKSTTNIGSSIKKVFNEAVVVEGDFGLNICFTRISGGVQYGKLNRNSTLTAGQMIDLDTVTLTTLERDGQEIYKYDGKAIDA